MGGSRENGVNAEGSRDPPNRASHIKKNIFITNHDMAGDSNFLLLYSGFQLVLAS